jgi:hypothetical protein
MRLGSSIRGGLGERNLMTPFYIKVKKLANTDAPIWASLERIHVKSSTNKSCKIRVLFVLTRPITNIVPKKKVGIQKGSKFGFAGSIMNMDVGLCSNTGKISLVLCFERLSYICNCSKMRCKKCKIFGEFNQKWYTQRIRKITSYVLISIM